MKPQDVISLAKNNDCKFVDLKFIDLPGVWQHTTVPVSRLDEELFEDDHAKVRELNRKVTSKAGFENAIGVSGQTITRKQDARVAAVPGGIAASAAKFANDIRLLQHLGEIEEPFQKKQIGSSAMPYKRNPMRTERIGALARFALTTAQNPALTASAQWLERTLDDSANRRLSVPELFLTVDAILQLVRNVGSGLVVHEKRIEANLRRELPFLSCPDLAVFKAFFNRTKDWADLEAMRDAGTLDTRHVTGVLVEYLGADDERVAQLQALLRR